MKQEQDAIKNSENEKQLLEIKNMIGKKIQHKGQKRLLKSPKSKTQKTKKGKQEIKENGVVDPRGPNKNCRGGNVRQSGEKIIIKWKKMFQSKRHELSD